jgi:hypothetical protein
MTATSRAGFCRRESEGGKRKDLPAASSRRPGKTTNNNVNRRLAHSELKPSPKAFGNDDETK